MEKITIAYIVLWFLIVLPYILIALSWKSNKKITTMKLIILLWLGWLYYTTLSILSYNYIQSLI